MSRWENAPTLREIVKLSGVLIDLYCASYAACKSRSNNPSLKRPIGSAAPESNCGI
jgi:hypothetical protein